MPRTARVLLPSTAHHVVQRGHNRASVFAGDEDFQIYLDTLSEWKTGLGVRIYAYCLMTNHVHLIVMLGEDVSVLGKLMRRVAGRQTRHVNRVEGRTGTLWDGRYKASPIQTDRYLLACMRYVEMNPVRARMVGHAEAYQWSSYRRKVGLDPRGWLDQDPCFIALGENEAERAAQYASFVATRATADESALIREAVRRNQLTGNSRFVDEVEQRIGRRIERRGRGRPKKKTQGTRKK